MLNLKKNISVSILILILFFSCGRKKGEFFWAVSKELNRSVLEIKHFKPEVFYHSKKNLKFTTNEKIWWIYKPASSPSDNSLGISLSRKTLGWVSISEKNLKFNKEDDNISDTFSIKQPGCYLLKIANDGNVIDKITFKVEYPSSFRFQKDLDLDDPEPDEILKFSKNVADSQSCP